MALSPQQIQEARAKLGISVPDTTPTPQSSFAEKLAAARKTQEVSKPKLGQGAAGEFAGNVVRSVVSPLVRTGGAIESVLDNTVGRGINAVKGNGFTPTTSGQQAQQAAQSIEDNASDTTAGKIGGVVGTVAPYFTGTGEAALASKIPSAVPKVLSVLAKKAPTLARDIALGTAQTGDAEQGVEIGVGGQALGALAKPVKALSEGAYKALAIPVSKQEAKLLQTYKANVPFSQRVKNALLDESVAPTTADDTAFRKGLWGTEGMIGVQAKRASDNLWKDAIKPALKRTETTVDMPNFFAEAESKIIKDTPELNRRGDLLEALDALKESYKDVGEVPLATLQDFKKGWAARVPQKAYQGKDIAGAFADVKNIVSGLSRKKIYEALGPDVKQAYVDHGNLQSLAEWGQTAMTGSKFKGGTGGWLTALKDTILTPIATVGGHTIYKVGEGMEFIGAPGARYLSDIFNEESQP